MTREFIITKEFDCIWKELGLNDDDLSELEIYLCKNPDCGDTLEGTGGVKKFRWALEGRGKSGGARNGNKESRKGGSRWQKIKHLKAL